MDRATGWLEDRTEVYSATYENNQIVAEHYSGPGTKEDFLKQTDENKISRIFYHPAPPLKGRATSWAPTPRVRTSWRTCTEGSR